MTEKDKVQQVREERDAALKTAAEVINASFTAAIIEKDYGFAAIRAAKMLREKGLLVDLRENVNAGEPQSTTDPGEPQTGG